jgi:hypothetical protein
VLVEEIGFVRDLDEHVGVAPAEEKVRRGVGGPEDRPLVAQPVILAEVEERDDDDQAASRRCSDHAVEAAAPSRLERAVGAERRYDRTLVVAAERVLLGRAAALKAYRDGSKPGGGVSREHRVELARVPLGAPPPCVRIPPPDDGLGVLVVEHRLDHAAVQQHPFDPRPAMGHAAVQPKVGARDRHDRPGRGRRRLVGAR